MKNWDDNCTLHFINLMVAGNQEMGQFLRVGKQCRIGIFVACGYGKCRERKGRWNKVPEKGRTERTKDKTHEIRFAMGLEKRRIPMLLLGDQQQLENL